MKRIHSIIALVSVLALAVACEENNPDKGLEIISYTASDAIIPNPERGFYVPAEVYRADMRGISEASLNAARTMGRTVFLLEFHLTDYVATAISEDYLETIRARFQSLRDGGAKCILRFCYSNGFAESDKPWDAPLDLALSHIAQVKPLIQEYSDVIMVLQAGFIGSWGEWYYTENYKDNASRKALVDALLDAVPAERQIELRTPAFKMKLYGYTLADTLTRAEAHQPTIKARLAGHNDCYLSGPDDVGTFKGPNERKYWQVESQFTIMGGESCEITHYCHCEGTDKYNGAIKDLALTHFTYLNSGYHKSVLSRWKEEGCYDEIQKRLGYRYVLTEGKYTKKATAGKEFRVELKIRNDGFAPAQNPRDAELVLANSSGAVLGTWPLDSDPRYWMPGEETVISKIITLPEGISGEMSLYLNLPDPCKTLHDNPLFSIRLANEWTWQEDTGYNKLYSFQL